MKRTLLVIVLCVAGCATDEHAEDRSNASRWDDLAHDLAALTADYCAAEPWARSSCAEDAEQYVAGARVGVAGIHAMALRMDQTMGSLGRAALADGVCTAEALDTAVERHAAAACGASGEEAASEARRHCAAMLDLTAQMHVRSDVAMYAMSTTYYSGSGSMGRVRHRTSTGHHDWPWAASEQPAAVPTCPSSP
jgi:hypothetical protein